MGQFNYFQPIIRGMVTTEETTTTFLPVGTRAGMGYRTIARVVCPPAQPGDVLVIWGRGRVTSELPYAVGVDPNLFVYDVDGDQTMIRVSTANGDNVFVPRHHMPLFQHDVYQLPVTWVPGHRPVVALRMDAESTAATLGATIKVDNATCLTVIHLGH